MPAREVCPGGDVYSAWIVNRRLCKLSPLRLTAAAADEEGSNGREEEAKAEKSRDGLDVDARYRLRRREPRLSTPARLDADGVARLQLDASRRDGDVVQLEDRGEGLHGVDGESDKQ